MSTSSLGLPASAPRPASTAATAPTSRTRSQILAHPRVPGCVLGVLADGMGGKSGGRKAADQVLLTAQQLFERYAPDAATTPAEVLKQLVLEAHLMIKLTAITAEEEPHSTIAAFLDQPDARVRLRPCRRLARLPLPRRRDGRAAPIDHSYVQRLVDERRDHRGRGQHPSAVEPADRLPRHAARTRR